MAIWVTGAAGFIGSRVIARLNQRKIPTVSIDHLPFFLSRPSLLDLSMGELFDISEISDRLPSLEKPTAILHMGACSDTTETRAEIFARLNLGPSQWFWNYACEHDIPFVYASSAATYGDGSQGYSDEFSKIHELKPLNLYGQSKQDFDLFVRDATIKRHTPSRWLGLKFFNVFGFGERHKGAMSSVVSKAFQEIHRKGELALFTSDRDGIPDGGQSRDFVFVEDLVDLILRWLDHKQLPSGLYNAGSGKARSFLELAKSCFSALKIPTKIRWIEMPEHLKGKYQYFTQADMTRAIQELNHVKRTELEDGVRMTFDQYKKYDQRRPGG